MTNLIRPRKRSKFQSLRLLFLTLLLTSVNRPAQASFLNSEGGGSIKSIGSLQRLRQEGLFPNDIVPQFEERLRFHGALSNNWLRIEAAEEMSLFYQRANPPFFPFPDLNPRSAWAAKWDLYTTDEISISGFLNRAFIQLSQFNNQIIVGKQVIATGVGQLFQAVSQVQRYPYVFIDTEYEKTEDAVTVILAGPLQLEFRFLPKVPGQNKDSFHVRAKGSKAGYDTALTAGRSDDKIFMGLEAAGNLGDAVLRGEIVGYEKNSVNWIQGLVGLDYVFSAKWSAKVEGFYNGFGKKGDYLFEPFMHRSAPYRGQWYGATHVTFEAHALLKINFLIVANLNDPSSLLNLSATYSLADSLDLLVGQFFSVGGEQSEFGGKLTASLLPPIKLGQTDVTYAVLRYYF